MAFIGWLCITALALVFVLAGLLALIGVGEAKKAWQPLLIGAICALVSVYNQPFLGD